MKKWYYLTSCVVMLLMTNLIVTSCSSDNEIDTRQNFSMLYGKWVLQGYVSNGDFVSFEKSETGDCYLLLEENGNYNGRFCNSVQGEYSYSQNGEFLIQSCISTMVWATDSDIMFVEEKIGKKEIRSFETDGNSLRLYYSPSDYLRFSR